MGVGGGKRVCARIFWGDVCVWFNLWNPKVVADGGEGLTGRQVLEGGGGVLGAA